MVLTMLCIGVAMVASLAHYHRLVSIHRPLLPHDAMNRYNLAVSLLCKHDVKRGEQEARRALELATTNPMTRAFVDAIEKAKRAVADRAPSSADGEQTAGD